MFPIQSFMERFEGILAELDALAAARSGDAEALEDLNAEFEDALLLLGELDLREGDWREELDDALEELRSLAGDYRALAGEDSKLAELANRLGMAVDMAAGSLRP